MSNVNAEKFIEAYIGFYFGEKTYFEEYGIPHNLKSTDVNLEKYIVTNKLNKGKYDAEAFAWKAGRAKWENDGFEYESGMKEKWINGNGNPIKLKKDSDSFTLEDFEEHVNKKELDYNKEIDIKEFYKEVAEKYNLYNFGTVNIINVMFFLSKGAIPIYDYFAHVAVKALLMDKNPKEIFVPDAPGKGDHPRGKEGFNKEEYYLALNLLEEYMWLLDNVFGEEKRIGITDDENQEAYISRELDRALWVYGHAYKKWPV